MGALSGRTALVTGASRGIGRAIALALGAEGAAVGVHYRKEQASADTVVRSICAAGGQAASFGGDLAEVAASATLIRSVEAALGPVDILVNNAGVARQLALDEVTLAVWEEAYAVNVRPCFLLSQAVVPGMRERRWGRLIFLGSVAAHTGGVIGPHYASSKAAVWGLMHSYANLLAKEGITSNLIAPALIETDMLPPGVASKPGVIPVGRLGAADEVADVAVLLAKNAYITGQTIHVNGGWYMS